MNLWRYLCKTKVTKLVSIKVRFENGQVVIDYLLSFSRGKAIPDDGPLVADSDSSDPRDEYYFITKSKTDLPMWIEPKTLVVVREYYRLLKDKRQTFAPADYSGTLPYDKRGSIFITAIAHRHRKEEYYEGPYSEEDNTCYAGYIPPAHVHRYVIKDERVWDVGGDLMPRVTTTFGNNREEESGSEERVREPEEDSELLRKARDLGLLGPDEIT